MSTPKFFLTYILIFISINLLAQQSQVYNPQADAKHDLDSAITLAKQTNRNVFVQIGGNWCPWCILMHNFYTTDNQIDSMLNIDYVPVLVNYSRENKNKDIMESFKFPQRFGFPVIVILDTTGNLIHTQNTLYLEDGEGYNKEKFIDFLKHWNTEALNPENY